MSEPFQVGGPLLAGSPVYVRRKSDKKASDLLLRMEYMTLVEPRQHGKTSLIFRLIDEFMPRGFAFALCDLMAAKATGASCAAWLTSLGQRILAQLDFIPEDRRPMPPDDCSSWESFLTAVAKEAVMAGRKVVIALDEIGAMPADWATGFFSIIRSIYTTRQNCPHWQHLTFVISGAFNPRDLIKDKTVSNFNIDQRILLRDFDELQIRSLVELIGLPDRETAAAARRVHYWADGQPYLSQYLCKALAACRAAGGVEPIDAIVDQAVDTFFHEDTSHLTRIKELVDDVDLLAYTRKITSGTPARFSPGLNDKQFRLAHILGVIKADSQGRCRIRNRIYERALDELCGTVDGELCRTPNPPGVIPLLQRDRNRQERIEDAQNTGQCPESRVPSHPTIFVSYSQKDAKYKEEFERHMAPLRRYHHIETWSDEHIPLSSDWRSEIIDAMERAVVAVVLVTSNLLDSDFCMDVELRRFVQARAERGLKLVAVMVSDCYWQAVPDLERYQILPRGGTSITSVRNHARAWSKVVKEIGTILDIQLP